MFRFIIAVLFFLLSLLVLFSAPAIWLWYVAIVVTEFPWVFVLLGLITTAWAFRTRRLKVVGTTLALAATFIFSLPIIQALQISGRLDKDLNKAFNTTAGDRKPFSPLKMITGIGASKVPCKSYTFDPQHNLALDYYPSAMQGNRPCIVVVHGGSWKGGDSKQLPELNSELAKQGYNVAAINYRKAPQCHSPGPLEDTRAAITYLRTNAVALHIDTSKFVMLGRSAGGQIALLAAYTFKNMGIKGAISYYGPADMIWGYQNPAIIYNSCEVLEDYIGDTYEKLPSEYRASSPFEAVDSSTVPTLLIHGKNDVLVAYGHSTRLVERLDKYGVPNYLLTLPWATHGCDYTLNGPSGQLATYSVERFLATLLF
ncbi:alpha/beta hydrolase [Polluticoccus soli]|uniref:alpha/beta hydrolase n=1 Tax=Polluticoccus soli TaxID=3034150 RepID=UPI0023E0F67A|nr:alpha/beta hydrolase [Flavipsychrobacter sp. JY13-12]